MTGPRRIALLMSQDAGFHRQVLLGIRALRGPRQAVAVPQCPAHAGQRSAPWRNGTRTGSSPISTTQKFARAVLKLRKPMIDTACVLAGLGIPLVDVDHVAVGRLAAEHFLTRGYRHFGYFGSGRGALCPTASGELSPGVENAGFEVRCCHVEYLPRLPEPTSWKSVNAQVRQLAEGNCPSRWPCWPITTCRPMIWPTCASFSTCAS